MSKQKCVLCGKPDDGTVGGVCICLSCYVSRPDDVIRILAEKKCSEELEGE